MKRVMRTLMLVGLLAVSYGAIVAQEFRGSISGRVTDPNGAIVAGAQVTVKNTGTNITNTAVVGDDGSYNFPFLLPGKYNVTAVSDGFKTAVRENIEMNVDARLTVDIQLEIGAQADVTVSAGNEVVERGSVTTGLVINQRQVEELPQPEGAVFTLVTQTPGVNYTGNPQFTGPTANGNLAAFRSNGAAGNQINLDGSPNLGSAGAVAFTPPGDAVQEFKVQTNSFDAQQGFTAGSTVNVALKSGTNKFHGSAYLFNRDRSRTANNFFNNRAGRERPERKYNRYGGMVNGPIFRDRTFFLFTYERQKDNVAEPTTFLVPTAKQRMGDFSELPSTLIYDPATAFTGTGGTTGCATGVICRTAFANNIIPTARINPIALKYLSLFPLPNLPTATTGASTGIGQYFTNMNLIRPYKSYLGRIDHNFNQNHKVFGKYYFSRSDEDRYNWLGQDDSITRGFEIRKNKGGNINYTATLSSSLIFDVRGGYTEFSQQRLPANPVSPESLGFTGAALASFRGATVIPRFEFTSFNVASISNALGSNRSDYNEGLVRPFKVLSVQPTLTQVWGTHTLKYGYDFRRLREDFASNGYNAGRFLFDGTYTVQASSGTNASTALRSAYGRDLAAFLLGIPTASTSGSLADNPTAYNVSSNYQGFFVQDDWRLNRQITLNLGLRYELETGVRESGGRIAVGFDRTSANPLQAAAQANFAASPPAGVTGPFNVLGGLLFASDSAQANQKTDKNNFQPRAGVSYALSEKMVIRAGAGVFAAPFQIQTPNQLGYSTPTLFTASTNNGLSFVGTLSNPFPNGIAASPGSSLGLATGIGGDITIASNERQNAQYARFIFGIQRELPWKLGLEATYVYSKGYDLPVARQINVLPRSVLNSTATFDSTVSTFLTTTVANPFRGIVPASGNSAYNAATIARRNLLLPFPQFGNVNVTEYNGYSTYNALQLQVVKRFDRGLSLNASYTLSREREATTRLNPQDDILTEQIAANDRPHRFTFSTIYELPIGHNRAFGKNWNRVLDAVIGGWQVQTNYEWQSGEPLQLGNVYYNGDPSTLKNRIGQYDEQGRKYGVDIPAFDLSGFYFHDATVQTNGVDDPTKQRADARIGLGNINTIAGSNTLRYFPLTLGNLRNQRFLNFNAGISKNFRIREGMKFQVRIEGINVLNSPYFTTINLTPTSSAFGLTSSQRQPPRDIQIGGRFTF